MSDLFDQSKYFTKGMINSIGNNLTGGLNMAATPSVNALMGLKPGESGFGTAPIIPEGMQSIYDTGHTVGTIASLLPIGVGAVRTGASLVKPATEIIKSLIGSKPLTEAQGIADLLKNSHSATEIQALEKPVMEGYKSIFDKFGTKHNIYEKAPPSKEWTIDEMNAAVNPADTKLGYNDIENNSLKDIYSKELLAKHNAYKEAPTLHNAHDLRMQLDKDLRELNAEDFKTNLYTENLAKDNRRSYNTAKQLVENDMKKFMQAKNPELAEAYDKVDLGYRNNVAPRKDVADLINASGGNDPELILNYLKEAPRKYTIPKDVRANMGSMKDLLDQHYAGAARSGLIRDASMGLGALAGIGGAGAYSINKVKNILGD